MELEQTNVFVIHIIDNTWLLNKCHIYLACTDTPSWNDGSGTQHTTCEDYRTKYCWDNSAKSLAGVSYNFPEKNCCGCGKGNEILGILFKP